MGSTGEPSPAGGGLVFIKRERAIEIAGAKKRERAIDIALASRLCDHSKLKI